jgi:hypothetical protein
MINYRRDNEDLKAAIREHSIADYPLVVPKIGPALGISTSTIRDITSVVVEPLKPMTFDDLADLEHWDTEPNPKQFWVNYARSRQMPQADRDPLRWIYPTTRARLDAGEEVSHKDIMRDWLIAQNQLAPNGRVLSYSFDMKQVSIDPKEIRPGMLVQFEDGSDKRVFPGRVVGIGEDPADGSRIIYLEMFEPVPALLGPEAVSTSLIQPEFMPDRTWALGRDTLRKMNDNGVPVPAGMFDPNDKEKKVYFLDQPMPISEVEAFCNRYFPGNKHRLCVLQSAVFTVLPIHPAAHENGVHSGGRFKPYPDDIQTTEIEAQIDYYGEGMEFEG